jgi:hypothetical protein
MLKDGFSVFTCGIWAESGEAKVLEASTTKGAVARAPHECLTSG